MRVLWFINTSVSAANGKDDTVIYGGWIYSLQRHLLKTGLIQLGIVYPAEQKQYISFTSGGTMYYGYPSFRDKGVINGLIGRWRHVIESSVEVSSLKEIVDDFQPDLIHIFGSEKHYGLIAGYTKIPVVVQIQGNLTACKQKWFSGVTFYEVLKNCNKKNLLLGYGIYHQYFLLKKRSARELDILSRSRFIIGRTEWDKRLMKLESPESRYYHCEELLRDDFYNKQWLQPSGGKLLLMSILSPLIYKGLEAVLTTSRLLKGAGDFDFEWQIAGIRGTEELVRIIEKSRKLKFQENNVRFLGALNAAELSGRLISSHLFIHPSHIENSPNSVCEAMLLGIPIIATYAGGTSSILKDSEDGILVQDGDPYSLAGTILQLSNSPESMKLYSEKARSKALSRHDPEKVVKSVLDIYHNVIDNS
jgi:glycosyltransferase involved in cell wall biosynthesis